jgi:hypothetical protein
MTKNSRVTVIEQSLAPEAINPTGVTALQGREKALQERLKSLEAKLGESAAKHEALMAKAKAAQDAKLEVIGNEAVRALVREGKLSGNSVAAFRVVYLTALKGETVTAAQMEALAAALPKMPARR